MSKIVVPLYHGTDKKILDYTQAERESILALCNSVSEYSYNLLTEDGLSISNITAYKAKRFSLLNDNWSRILDSFQKYDSRKNGSVLFQYGCLYFTVDRLKAENYARNAFIMGEQGMVAYWLYMAVTSIWNIKNYSPCIVDMYNSFKRLVQLPHIPIVITFSNISLEDLLDESGREIGWMQDSLFLSGLSFRLKPDSEVNIFDGTIEFL